ncbi:MAG: bifunctional [glutamate--ammonia ligase]-adenylyl-L-tyrosine phosphorylase/[glutamate--ammonia-ligase] adenylyltransferase [Gammaproteobacteria bacterium]|nr:bifunctional [glutamate--ammonia ligase]-adenylyl-L-tyrosine phosphorylase/[glutamate--ammonia-ligase] adenylyltransferase [Gammaproteobacteria bacterium]
MRTSSDDQVPVVLREAALQRWSQFQEAALAAGTTPPTHPELLAVLRRVWACSDFVAQSCIQEPHLLSGLLASGDLLREYSVQEYASRLEGVLAAVGDEAALDQALRRCRRREMVRIAWRDIAGWAPLAETLHDLSALAEACIDAALRRLHAWQAQDYGTPHDTTGAAQALVVMAMGKLGGAELNFSSDIDLIFAYPADGETRGKRLRISNEEYFLRLGQRLIGALGSATAQGFVFRVDVRLRPFGDSGPLSASFAALEEYYQVHGREWERYAWIKARVVGGDRTAGAQLLDTLRPFVYRRYLDFGVFESLRDMKRMIREETARKGAEDNIKLGPGGIREIEFIAQVFQLIRGGRNPDLQIRGTLAVLEQLAGHGYLPEQVVRELTVSYEFLRRTENRLQEVADEQTHRLPESDFERARLAFAMGYGDWVAFEQTLRAHRVQVQGHFEQVFAAPQATAEQAADAELARLWLTPPDEAEAERILNAHGFTDAAEAWRRITALRDVYACRALSAQGRGRMDRLLPLALGAIAAQTQQPAAVEATVTLARVLTLVEAVTRRTAYLALLTEHPLALSQVVQLCAASPWIAALLARQPLLLDELLDPRTLYAPLAQASLAQDLQRSLQATAAHDLEQQMDALRHFRQAQMLRVAATQIMRAPDALAVCAHLSDIAEAVLQAVLALAWRQLGAKHGIPRYRENGLLKDAGFAVVAYGKLGGRELSYASDLDLVFLHDSGDDEARTTGPQPLDNAVFFARLGQRIIHLLNTRTQAGVLYEVDTRLRPSGASGLLVASLTAFADYQRQQAWTWEHQALVRARVVAQHPAQGGAIAAHFSAVREEVLGRARARADLRTEVTAMRARMRSAHASTEAGRFDLKQDAGGITDIEFMVQYAALLHAHEVPELVRRTHMADLLACLAVAGKVTAAQAETLTQAWRAYIGAVHRLALQEAPAQVAAKEFTRHRKGVIKIWRAWFEESGRSDQA